MPRQKAHSISQSEIHSFRDDAEKTFAEILRTIDSTAKGAPRVFASGIELIKVTLKAGSNIEFTVLVAGKDAPKIEPLAFISEHPIPPRSNQSRDTR
jgi:hypothetical protein